MTTASAKRPEEARARPRSGPRPLPLHLAAAAMTWSSSQLASTSSKPGSLPWRPNLQVRAAALESEIASLDPEAFSGALGREILARSGKLLRGIEVYRRHPYRRNLAEPPTLWREGGSQLLDYAPAGGVPLFVVPSLVNRAYILDLAEGQSFLRWLAEQGFRPLLLDWGAPGAAEEGYDLTDYIGEHVDHAHHISTHNDHADHIDEHNNHTEYIQEHNDHTKYVGEHTYHADHFDERNDHADDIGEQDNHADRTGDDNEHIDHVCD